MRVKSEWDAWFMTVKKECRHHRQTPGQALELCVWVALGIAVLAYFSAAYDAELQPFAQVVQGAFCGQEFR